MRKWKRNEAKPRLLDEAGEMLMIFHPVITLFRGGDEKTCPRWRQTKKKTKQEVEKKRKKKSRKTTSLELDRDSFEICLRVDFCVGHFPLQILMTFGRNKK